MEHTIHIFFFTKTDSGIRLAEG